MCFLFSFLRPEHEATVASRLREAGFFVSPSSEILPEFRECPDFFQGLRGVLRVMPRLFRQVRYRSSVTDDAIAQVDSDNDGVEDGVEEGLDPLGLVAFDGRSLLPMIDGDVASHESEFYITECTWMRKHGWRTPEWKLIQALEPDFHFKPEIELYNLVEDPDELKIPSGSSQSRATPVHGYGDHLPSTLALSRGQLSGTR